MLPIADHTRAVDPYLTDAMRKLMRLLERRAICNGLRIEDHDIGEVAGEEQSALAQAKARRHGPAHLADRLFQ